MIRDRTGSRDDHRTHIHPLLQLIPRILVHHGLKAYTPRGDRVIQTCRPRWMQRARRMSRGDTSVGRTLYIYPLANLNLVAVAQDENPLPRTSDRKVRLTKRLTDFQFTLPLFVIHDLAPSQASPVYCDARFDNHMICFHYNTS